MMFSSYHHCSDVLIGMASSGVHSNGYSLVRHLVSQSGLDYSAPCPFQSGMAVWGMWPAESFDPSQCIWPTESVDPKP